MDAIRPEIATAEEDNHPRRPRLRSEERIAQAPALIDAHRAVVEVEVQITDAIAFDVADFTERSLRLRCLRCERHARNIQFRAEHLHGGQLDTRAWAVVLGFQVCNPDGTVDRAAADRAVTLGEDYAGRSRDDVLRVCAVEVIGLAEQRIQYSRLTVGRADLPHDGFSGVMLPIDA